MALTAPLIDAVENARRTRIYAEALASIQLEGFDLDAHTQALYQRYMEGKLTLGELESALDELDHREFGPVSLSRHDRT